MKLTSCLLVASFVAALTTWIPPAVAEEVSLASYEDLLARIESLEAERSGELMVDDGAGCCDSCCQPCGHYYGRYESVIVAPHFSQNDAFFQEIGDDVINHSFDWDLEYTPRIEIGYLAPCGCLGWRARYWYFDHSTTLQGIGDGLGVQITDDGLDVFADTGVLDARHGLKLQTFDLETMTQNGGMIYSAGIRYGKMEQSFLAQTPGGEFVSVEHDLDGLGLTGAIEGRTQVGCSAWSVFAIARTSVVFGDSTLVAFADNDDTFTRTSNDVMPIGELQLGVDGSYCLGSGRLVFRAAAEGQYWINAGSTPAYFHEEVSEITEADMGLIGFNLGIGYVR